MSSLSHLLERNKAWSARIKAEDPNFFNELAQLQTPEYLWIGCADSRVPANEIIDLPPGAVFVHRNIANVVVHTDLNCLSVIQYAVDVLKVKHIIVCGHYGCGGVKAALEDVQHGFVDNWVRHIKDIYMNYYHEMRPLTDKKERIDKMCEMNVMQQVNNVCHTNIVQNAWRRGQDLSIHGWIYDLHDGVLNDLNVTISTSSEIHPIYRMNERVKVD